jgi:hypothetical protein
MARNSEKILAKLLKSSESFSAHSSQIMDALNSTKKLEDCYIEDDIEWLGALYTVFEALEKSKVASDFQVAPLAGCSVQPNRDKIRILYRRLNANGAFEYYQEYLGGHSDVRASDLLLVRQVLNRQLSIRVKGMIMPNLKMKMKPLGGKALALIAAIFVGVVVAAVVALIGF